MSDYLLAGQGSELERLLLQSEVWEPTGRRLLEQLGADGHGRRALDVGCGALGWLRLLSAWAGDTGSVLGTDVDADLLGCAATVAERDKLLNVRLLVDDLFASALQRRGFDLVHARLMIAPLGRAEEQLSSHLSLLAPGGVLVLEEPDCSSWSFDGPVPATQRLLALLADAFRAAGGDMNAGRSLPELLHARGLTPRVRTESVDLPPGHPFLRAPLAMAASLRPRLTALAGADELDALLVDAEAELSAPDRRGTTFTLVQAWARV
ncbi:class I SAM-dependent methyltransferase [Streptacidiphilus jiangxiensis]|uniref:Methyltransferase domain-containing protein n=1 Tax=Streptacidiphilus jiangxiensis TaxID=235985 RepID=A0A1H7XK87_STRJI|nr:methyltransferase domain-containing protein [Streptacidiphilus jiangxiensis]SEM34085.1 Methyltransferase domain-containing protein [Streptacidiphilus jiangxiensis]